jgi:NAD(P)-dependent dehydrogenase (short-subunit alcohol dehydrogenase family)
VFEIEGRHILVTGGSGGLGQHFARFLANNGAHITLAARRAEALDHGVLGSNKGLRFRGAPMKPVRGRFGLLGRNAQFCFLELGKDFKMPAGCCRCCAALGCLGF